MIPFLGKLLHVAFPTQGAACVTLHPDLPVDRVNLLIATSGSAKSIRSERHQPYRNELPSSFLYECLYLAYTHVGTCIWRSLVADSS